METTAKSESFISKVINYLKGGDEAKITRFHSKTVKHLDKQMSLRSDEIEQLNDKKADLKEKLQETVLNVDLDAIKSAESLERYIISYETALMNINREIEAVDRNIEALNSEIKELGKIKALIF